MMRRRGLSFLRWRGNLRLRRSKYGARGVHADGYWFPSQAEYRRYGTLKLLKSSGKIKDLVVHPRFPLVVKGVRCGTYVGDFVYCDCATGERVVEDVKGVRLPIYKLKAKMMFALYRIIVQEVNA